MNRDQLYQVLQDEAMARCRYELYAEIARSEGLHYYAKVFEETARNERSHFRELCRVLSLNGTTIDNLEQAIRSEETDANHTYPALRDQAMTENSLDSARLFQQIAKVEARHMERFQRLQSLLKKDSAFGRDQAILWKCRICGYIHEGQEPPSKCPACQSPGNCFEPDDFAL